MAALILDVCDEIVDWINGQSWSIPVHAVRTYDPDPQYIGHDVMSVYVLPAVESDSPEEDSTRGLESIRLRSEIHLRQRFDGGDQVPSNWVDDRIELLESIADALRSQKLDVGVGRTAYVTVVVMSRIWDRASLIDDQTYVGVIEAVVEVWY